MPVLAQRPREAELLAPAQLLVVPVDLAVPVQLPQEPELLVRVRPLVAAEPPLAVPVQLLSRQSFSAAMAGSTPRPQATYEPVPRSR